MKKHYLKLLFLLCFTSFGVKAQQYLGVITSNYAGIMGADLQPASIVDSRIKVDINLGSVNFGAWQNAKYFNADNMPKWWVKSFKTDTAWSKPDSSFYKNNFYDVRNPKGKARGINTSLQIDVLNFMFHVNPRIAIGFSAKFRTNVSVDNLTPQFISLVESGLNDQSLWNIDLKDKFLTMNSMSWAEYGINYAQVAYDKEEHFLKVGGRLKLLQGIAASYMQTDNFSYRLDNADTAAVLSGNFSYGYSKNFDQYASQGGINNFSDVFKLNSKLGVGADLGIVYEWRPKWKDYKYDMDGQTNLWRRDKEKYTLRIGASVLDIGGMKFEKGGQSRNFTLDEQHYNLRSFDKVTNLQTLDSVITADFDGAPDKGTFFMNLPTTASLQIDYHIWNDFYVNFTGVFNIINKKNPHKVTNPTQFSLTPSYDFKWFGVYVPLSYNQYSGFKAGLAARLGPITVGFTDWNSILASGKVRGTEFYFGLRLPILYTRPQDRDGDKVSDKKDECVDLPGVWMFRGCPDTDHDSIPDTKDDCPLDSGLVKFNGCPDRDGDGIIDKDDYCPDDFGDAFYHGCPDRDGDSIIDRDDKCPDDKGLAKFNGCPDTDGDGIADPDDACPTVAGPIENNGCPDTDMDGILDFLDDCPTIAGPKDNNGCPWPDTDGDGLLDKDDKCPYIAGPVRNNGCPYDDTDNDGVIDAEDQCPQTPGTVANHGCPEIEKEVQEVLKTAFDNLEFFTGKAVIKEESKPSLNDLADVLLKKPEWKLQIAGHTDNVGAAQANLILSKKRAEAVRDFMVSKGIDASRLSVLFFGETQPIESNDTEEGRQKNRRVEMTIAFN